ncbi:hypothetical protein BX591_105134 [Paraburkholderia bryophila]|uniref:Uncharacterized protein n=1 Tax=Paraburkholderia bryophila TaxID=420952 RepID=A0A329CXF0_9BURK|nr:hypothetical protein BX591_105134 [Paraburkholderia bryophila]
MKKPGTRAGSVSVLRGFQTSQALQAKPHAFQLDVYATYGPAPPPVDERPEMP